LRRDLLLAQRVRGANQQVLHPLGGVCTQAAGEDGLLHAARSTFFLKLVVMEDAELAIAPARGAAGCPARSVMGAAPLDGNRRGVPLRFMPIGLCVRVIHLCVCVVHLMFLSLQNAS